MTDKRNPFSPFQDGDFSRFDFTEMLRNIHIPGFDPDKLIEAQRRNLEALSRATEITAQGMNSVARRQTEFLNESMNELVSATEKLSQSEDARDLMTRQGQMVNQAYERALTNMRELSDMISDSNAEAYDTINQRIEESINELRTLAEGETPKPKKKK